MLFWKQGVPNIRSLPAGGLGKDAVLSEAKLHLGWACAMFLSYLFVWILWFSFLFLAGWPWLYSIYFNFDFNFCFYSRLGDLDWMNGAMSGTVYNSSHELGALMTEVLLFICFLLVCFCLGWIANLLDDLMGGDDPMPPTRCTAWQPGPTLFTPTPSQGWERWKPR